MLSLFLFYSRRRQRQRSRTRPVSFSFSGGSRILVRVVPPDSRSALRFAAKISLKISFLLEALEQCGTAVRVLEWCRLVRNYPQNQPQYRPSIARSDVYRTYQVTRKIAHPGINFPSRFSPKDGEYIHAVEVVAIGRRIAPRFHVCILPVCGANQLGNSSEGACLLCCLAWCTVVPPGYRSAVRPTERSVSRSAVA